MKIACYHNNAGLVPKIETYSSRGFLYSTVSPTLKRTVEVKIVLAVYILPPLNGEKSLPDDRVIDLSVLQRTNMYTISKVNDTIFYRSKATCTYPGRWQRLIKRNESYGILYICGL